MDERADALLSKLRIEPDSRVLCVPDRAHLGMVHSLPAVTADPAEADVALAAVTDAEDVDDFMTGYAHALAGTRAVWLLYPKGGAAPVNRDTIWAQLVGHGWRLVSNVAVDERWSALRARPLKPGEALAPPTPH